jgi:hypothetical protein
MHSYFHSYKTCKESRLTVEGIKMYKVIPWHFLKEPEDSYEKSVNIVTRLWAGQPRECGSILGRVKTSLQSIQTNSEEPTPSYSTGNTGSFSKGKVASIWSWPSPSCVKVKNEWSCTSTPPYAFIGCTWTSLLPFHSSKPYSCFRTETSKGRYTLVTLPRTVTTYRDCVDGTRDHVTYQKLVTG